MASSFNIAKCVINNDDSNEELKPLTSKGVDTVLSFCSIHERPDLEDYLNSRPPVVLAHLSCRKKFTDSRIFKKIKTDTVLAGASSQPCRQLRSAAPTFQWKGMCFLCGTMDIDMSEMRRVMTLTLYEKMRKIAHDRGPDDEWGLEIHGRLSSISCLVAEEAIYHKLCYLRFTTGRSKFDEGDIGGRAEDSCMLESFNKLCDWLETNCETELLSFSEVHQQLEELGNGQEVYSRKHLKRKLQERYGDHIFFAEMCGRNNVVCFRNMTTFIINEKWYAERKESTVDDNERIVKTAAKLIAAQIREMESNVSEYPVLPDSRTESQFIPPLLKTFMDVLIPSQLKRDAIGECIVHAARPRTVITPTPLGLGVELHHLFSSKYLIKQLYRLGFSVSYDEIIRYKQSVVLSLPSHTVTDEPYPATFTQWVADNVDHNTRTLDGYDTFHGMGIISATVPMLDNTIRIAHPIPRIKERVKSCDLVKGRGILLVPYHMSSKFGLATITLRDVQTLQRQTSVSQFTILNILWHTTWLLRNPPASRPNWSGFMQDISRGSHASTAVVRMHPLIDLNSSDETCIYSTLLFVEQQASKLNIVSPCITFDQPLWLKATDIALACKLNVVCRLGGFHILMSFLGSIGSVMSGSGIEEIFRLNYGHETVTHMMSGKAVARSIRGHFLLEGALMVLLLRLVVPTEASEESDQQNVDMESMNESISVHLVADLERILDDVQQNKLIVPNSTILENQGLRAVFECVTALSKRLASTSRTAKLWLEYIRYIDVLKRFIAAERTSDWTLHLESVSDMLNIFAATGHNNYAKSARLYLQLMGELPTSHPWLYEMFVKHGFHSVRRSDRFWGGLSTDLLIEQTMMRSLKSRGGLTRGSGFKESVRLVWVLTLHECASVHLAMSTLTGLHTTNQEHADIGLSRAKRDCKDMQKVIDWLEISNPFSMNDNRLRSLASGLVATESDNITCDNAEEIGAVIHVKWNEVCFTDVVSKKADQVRPLILLKKLCTVGNKSILIDANSLFHRLVVLVERSEDIPSFFSFELTAVPTSLFKDNFMRKPDKPALVRAVTSGYNYDDVPTNVRFVLDGGSLLHRVRWVKGTTYREILQQYTTYVLRKYGNQSVIVFDGYMTGPSVKDHEHKRRSGRVSKISPDILIDDNKPVVVDQQAFLANDSNKHSLIQLLARNFNRANIETHQADGDADTDIVNAALVLASSFNLPIGVVADDTDICVLLLYHLKPEMSDIYFISEAKKSRTGSVPTKVLNIRTVQKKIGSQACQQILTIHAFGGCDTVSAIFGHGKGSVYKEISRNVNSVQYTNILQDEYATRDEVGKAGNQLMKMLYGGKVDDNLNKMRYASYCKMAATSLKRPQPERLPPTDNATFFHSLRAHLQVIVWKKMNTQALKPTEWGWDEETNKESLVPTMTDKDPAPQNLLNIIRCKCKTSCTSSLCSCRKNGLKCVTACSNCHGEGCTNAEQACSAIETSSESDEDEGDEELIDDGGIDVVYDSDLYWCGDEELIDDGGIDVVYDSDLYWCGEEEEVVYDE